MDYPKKGVLKSERQDKPRLSIAIGREVARRPLLESDEGIGYFSMVSDLPKLKNKRRYVAYFCHNGRKGMNKYDIIAILS